MQGECNDATRLDMLMGYNLSVWTTVIECMTVLLDNVATYAGGLSKHYKSNQINICNCIQQPVTVFISNGVTKVVYWQGLTKLILYNAQCNMIVSIYSN